MPLLYVNQEELIKGLKNGDSNAYTQMVEMLHKKLCTYAYNLTGNQEWSEDIVQTVYINIWEKKKKIKSDIDLTNYLYKSIYNAFIDQYRKQRQVFSIEKVHIETLNTFIQETSESQKNRLMELVRKEIENLPPKCKKVFLLSRQDGLTNIEIAEYLNISKKSVEGHITKAFTRLREQLGAQYETFLFLLLGRSLVNKSDGNL